MKTRLIILLPALLLAAACTTLTGNYSYIPVGPQNLSVQVTDYKNIPIYINRSDITRPWSGIGLMRVQNLPNNQTVLAGQIESLKKKGAQKGADALIINQYFDDDNPGNPYPITLAAYLVKYLDNVSAEDKAKIEAFSKQAAIANARQ